MKEELFLMIQTVGLWVIVCLAVYIAARALGVVGNQLKVARNGLEKLIAKNNRVAEKYRTERQFNLPLLRDLTGLSGLAKKTLSHLDVFLFDNREQKRFIPARTAVGKVNQKYRVLIAAYAKGGYGPATLDEIKQCGEELTKALAYLKD